MIQTFFVKYDKLNGQCYGTANFQIIRDAWGLCYLVSLQVVHKSLWNETIAIDIIDHTDALYLKMHLHSNILYMCNLFQQYGPFGNGHILIIFTFTYIVAIIANFFVRLNTTIAIMICTSLCYLFSFANIIFFLAK